MRDVPDPLFPLALLILLGLVVLYRVMVSKAARAARPRICDEQPEASVSPITWDKELPSPKAGVIPIVHILQEYGGWQHQAEQDDQRPAMKTFKLLDPNCIYYVASPCMWSGHVVLVVEETTERDYTYATFMVPPEFDPIGEFKDWTPNLLIVSAESLRPATEEEMERARHPAPPPCDQQTPHETYDIEAEIEEWRYRW